MSITKPTNTLLTRSEIEDRLCAYNLLNKARKHLHTSSIDSELVSHYEVTKT